MIRTINPGKPPVALDPEALLLKAQRYAERVATSEDGAFGQGLAAALSLEFLARAALANVSPVLLVEGKQGWVQVHQALGYAIKETKPLASIGTADVIRRLEDIFTETFTKEVAGHCSLMAAARNAELHSGETPFDAWAGAEWQPRFYEASKALLATMGMGLKDFIDGKEAEVAEKLIAARSDKGAQAVRGEIESHRKKWEEKKGEDRERDQHTAEAWARKQDGHRVDCPACGSWALVFGDPVSAPQVRLEEEWVIEEQEHLPTHFECIACGLKVNGLSRLVAAGLGDRFKQTRTYDPAKYYTPTDYGSNFEDDNNEPF